MESSRVIKNVVNGSGVLCRLFSLVNDCLSAASRYFWIFFLGAIGY